jgi:hypothetical protein
MGLATDFEPPDLVLATLTGVVDASDQVRLVAWVRDSIRRVRTVCLLVRLEAFAGWHPAATLDTAASWLRDDEGVARIAIVGEPEWRVEVLTLIAQPLRRIPIEYFETEPAARRWLEQESGDTTHAMFT